MSEPVIIGHYRILEKIGSGAMGEVFRAHDERLGRDVALKLIRASSSTNPDHIRRFELEARAAAALNHPNIVSVYDVGSEQGTPYLVCELLEGDTLRELLTTGQLPVRKAVDYTLQMVEGLTAAHDHRIVHRDLKPENLFVTTDGRVKILDFGVAKLQSDADSQRPLEELTTVTRSGTVIGTVAYMAPEQLRGKPVDHRSDIFSVGAIFYEMLTGHRAFRGETEVDTMTSVLKEEPPEKNFVDCDVPLPCRQIVQHCVEKDQEKRFQSARDLAFALETLAEAPARKRTEPPPVKTRILPWAIAGLCLLGATILFFMRTPAKPPAYRRLTYEQGTVYAARFGQDAKSIVYSAAWNGGPIQLFTMLGDSLSIQPLALTDAKLLAVSRTGELAVTLHGKHIPHLQVEGGMLAHAPLAGGSPREVLEDVPAADWDANGELAAVHHMRDHDRIEYPIGHVLYERNGWISHMRLSPKGDQIAFIGHPTTWDDRGSVMVVNLAGQATTLTQEWESADGLAWSPDSKEIWFSATPKGLSRDIMAVTTRGKLRQILDLPAGITLQDISADGQVLVSVDIERIAMAATGRDGKMQDLSWHDWSLAKDISPDGESVLFEDSSEAGGANYSLVIRKLDGTPPVKLADGSAGTLSPDGKWAISIVPGSPGQVKLIPIGPGQPRSISVQSLDHIDNGNAHFLADGKRIMLNGSEPGHAVRSYIVDLDSGKATPITPEGIEGRLISPDGRHVVRADAAGVLSLYSIPDGAAREIPGLAAGFFPVRWSDDNSSVYGYWQGQVPTAVYKVNVTTGQTNLIQMLQPDAKTGVACIRPVVVNHDGSRVAYSYYQVFSTLYLVSGLN
ncbi:MAG TPA: protein kinase [Candidatus Binatia bacterium]|nr:protein kinase [Candidatus Binatia bacterium]